MRRTNSYYTKRAILLSSVIYIILILLLIMNDIRTPIPEPEEGILIDFSQMETLIEKKQELESENEELSEEARRNIAVNKALKGEKTSDPYDYSEVESPDDNYKESLVKKVISDQQYEDIFERKQTLEEREKQSEENKEDAKETSNTQQKNNAVYEGATYIEYDLDNRHKIRLPIPTYKCENEGRIIFSITVKPNGEISHYELLPQSSSDACLRKAATQSVKRTRFNSDPKAPEKQKGSISYTFEAQ